MMLTVTTCVGLESRKTMLTRAWPYQPHAHYYSGHFESGNICEKESKDNGIPPHACLVHTGSPITVDVHLIQ